jgi:hypothetical protein
MAASSGTNEHDNEEGWQEPSARHTAKARTMTQQYNTDSYSNTHSHMNSNTSKGPKNNTLQNTKD